MASLYFLPISPERIRPEPSGQLLFNRIRDCFRAIKTAAERTASQRQRLRYDDLLKRAKVNLDCGGSSSNGVVPVQIFWLCDESREDSANLPDPERAGVGDR
jgi:hypothetical protein